jgi:ATP-dependent DNA helicase RecG
MCRELEVNGSTVPVFHTDDFIFKVTVAKVTEKLPENSGKVTENDGKVTENSNKVTENSNKVTENSNKVTEKVANKLQKVTEKALQLGDVLTENKLKILHLIIEDPYITKSDLVSTIGISYTSISRNIEAMRDKYLRRVGPDKGGFWEIIE